MKSTYIERGLSSLFPYPSADGHPETMKITRRWTDVVRASRPQWHGHPARARERNAPATAGGTPAARFSEQGEIPRRLWLLGMTG